MTITMHTEKHQFLAWEMSKVQQNFPQVIVLACINVTAGSGHRYPRSSMYTGVATGHLEHWYTRQYFW